MFLNYLSLFMLILSVTISIYVLLYIHDIPHRIAKQRNHPQAEAIHVACWLSLFTLHALWPLVFMWAVSKKQAFTVAVGDGTIQDTQLSELLVRLESVEKQTKALEVRVMEGQS